jgi:hypothetical protein
MLPRGVRNKALKSFEKAIILNYAGRTAVLAATSKTIAEKSDCPAYGGQHLSTSIRRYGNIQQLETIFLCKRF